VIQVTFDPGVITYQELLEVFFAFHDPTTRNRQGPDVGTQYRSVILVESAAQRAQAEAMIARLTAEGIFSDPIVTEVQSLDRFWPGEAYHQQYFRRNPDRAYCAALIAPKVAKLRAAWAGRLKPEMA
jgi:peptide-methionine (S)-S-oxide reductase